MSIASYYAWVAFRLRGPAPAAGAADASATASSRQPAVCTAGQCIGVSARRCMSVWVETVTASPDLENA